MKFRAIMRDLQYMREFQNIIVTLSKLTKECVMKLSSDKVYFIANEESGTTAPLVWVEIAASVYFSEYKMEGCSAEYPDIMLSASAANMNRAFAVLRHSARYCKVKLANIQFPCLTIETSVLSQCSEQTRNIVHDIPVTVIPPSDWPHYALPQKPGSDLVLCIPSNRLIRGIIDKIKNLSPTVVFYATDNGELNLVAETETATITTRYKRLRVTTPNASASASQTRDRSKGPLEASCSIDCKKTALLFSALQLPAVEMSCGIADDRLIHIEVNIREGIAMHSILPAVCL